METGYVAQSTSGSSRNSRIPVDAQCQCYFAHVSDGLTARPVTVESLCDGKQEFHGQLNRTAGSSKSGLLAKLSTELQVLCEHKSDAGSGIIDASAIWVDRIQRRQSRRYPFILSGSIFTLAQRWISSG